jgi:hypothetical protein
MWIQLAEGNCSGVDGCNADVFTHGAEEEAGVQTAEAQQ